MTTEGDSIIRFLSRFCRHPRGEHVGKPVVLVPEQQEVLRKLFEVDDDGLWKHREAAIVVHRKWAKTLISSGLSLFCLTVRPMGTEVYFAANSRIQAGILKKNVDAFALSSKALRKRLYVYKNKIETPHGSHIMVLGADAHQAHGYNPYVSIIDEYWAFRNNDLPEALSSGAAARAESMTLYITTPGVDMNSPLGQLLERAERGKDDSLFVHWPGKHVPHNVDVMDEEAWREFNIGYRHGWIARNFMRSQALSLSRDEFIRLHLGGWMKRSAGWMDMYKFDDCGNQRLELEPNAHICLFVDGAWKHDSMALMACTTGPQPKLVTLRVWERPVYDDSWRVPYSELDTAVRSACAMYHVRQIGCDPFFLGQLMQTWMDDGLPVLEVPTNSTTRSVPATKRFYDAIMEQRVEHDGNPVLRRHISNCVPKVDARGLRIARDRNNSTAYIDAAVAAVFAYDMASKLSQEPNIWLY